MDLAIRVLNLGLGAARLGVRIAFAPVRVAAHIAGLDHHESTVEHEPPAPARPARTPADAAPARPAPIRVESAPAVEADVEVATVDDDAERTAVEREPDSDGQPRPAGDAEPVSTPEASEAERESQPPAAAPNGAAATAEPADLPDGLAPDHLDDEPELVAEFAEEGAEEGAHAELHVAEPWDGYRRMKVADVIERVAVADTAQLAVVQLYESTQRNRRSILQAVERRSRELANEPQRR